MQGQGRQRPAEDHVTTMFPPPGRGIGLRPPHYERVLADDARIGWLEVITENFLVRGGNPRRVLRAARERYPVVLHGVGLSIGSTDPLDARYLEDLSTLIAEIEPSMVSDHLCWASFGGHSAHDLWPLPYTEDALDHVVRRVQQVQDRLGRRILLENPSTYATFVASELDEAAFLAEVARRADCGIVLDVNNMHVSAKNQGFDTSTYLATLPPERIGYVHLAGHDDSGSLCIDTHDRGVSTPVWELYREAVRRFGAVPSLVEWDDAIPSFDRLIAESERAGRVADEVARELNTNHARERRCHAS